MEIFIPFAVGVVVGILVTVGLFFILNQNNKKKEALLVGNTEATFQKLSVKALNASNKMFLRMAEERLKSQQDNHAKELDSKKQLIDQRLEMVTGQISEMTKLINQFENTGVEKLGAIGQQLSQQNQATNQNMLETMQDRFNAQQIAHTTELESKKMLIDQRLEQVNKQINQLASLVGEFEEHRAEKIGALGHQLEQLTQTSNLLQRALADNRARGQWGERIAEDILVLCGFIKGVNYDTQRSLESGSRPDFTFLLPNDVILHMDAKFPLDNYMASLSAEAKADQDKHSREFMRDVKKCIDDTTKRGYITPETVDYVLVFIPNEQIYRYIYETDSKIIDYALKNKIVLCSPISLYSILAIIRQSTKNFMIEKSAKDVLRVLANLRDEWERYEKRLSELGNHLDRTRDAYSDVVGVRKRQMERQLQEIDKLIMVSDLELETENA